MENIKFSVFDIFAYLLPGSIVLVAIVLLSTPSVSNISEYLEMTKDISLALGIIAVVISYIIGNITDNFGTWLYFKIGCKIWGDPYPEKQHPKLSHAQQRALVREFSRENFNVLHTWKVLKTMSHNLSFAMLLLTIVSVARAIQYPNIQWIIISIVSTISAIILLHRASIYDRWHYHELLETVEVLQLEKKVNSIPLERLKNTRKSKKT